jgi:hypothetical protein
MSDPKALLVLWSELPDIWRIFVQSAVYTPIRPIRDDHPDPARRGKIFKYPEAIKGADNDICAKYEDLRGSRTDHGTAPVKG